MNVKMTLRRNSPKLLTILTAMGTVSTAFATARATPKALLLMLVKWDAGTLNFTPTCAKALLLEQKRYMGEYIRCLQVRAEVEGIELE